MSRGTIGVLALYFCNLKTCRKKHVRGRVPSSARGPLTMEAGGVPGSQMEIPNPPLKGKTKGLEPENRGRGRGQTPCHHQFPLVSLIVMAETVKGGTRIVTKKQPKDNGEIECDGSATSLENRNWCREGPSVERERGKKGRGGGGRASLYRSKNLMAHKTGFGGGEYQGVKSKSAVKVALKPIRGGGWQKSRGFQRFLGRGWRCGPPVLAKGGTFPGMSIPGSRKLVSSPQKRKLPNKRRFSGYR